MTNVMRATRACLSFATVWLVAGNFAFAADHVDIDPSIYSASTDISDVFAFPVHSEDGSHKLALIMALHPGASAAVPTKLEFGSWFSDAVDYRFRIRRARVEGSASEARFDIADEEFDVSCRFSSVTRGEDHKNFQRLECKIFRVLKDGSTPHLVTSTTVKSMTGKPEDESGGKNSRLLAFAGLRADPFFISLERILSPLGYKALGLPELPQGWRRNPLSDKNVLGIAVEVDIPSVFGSSDLGTHFAVVGNVTLERKVGDAVEHVQIDRMGRVEVTNFWLGAGYLGGRGNKPLWNKEDSFHVSKQHFPIYQADIQRSLASFKKLEGGTFDWTPDAGWWINLMINDYLLVDVAKPVAAWAAPRTYLEIESARFRGEEPKTCGGRCPNEDVLDRTLTLLISGPGPYQPEQLRGDGVDAPASPAGEAFPFLSPPYKAPELPAAP